MWFIWGPLKEPLKKLLGKKFSLVSKYFKVLKNSIVDDVIDATRKNYPAEIITDVAQGNIYKGDRQLLFVTALPLDAISRSSKIRKALVEKLKANASLEIARDKGGFGKNEWDRILDSYAGDLLLLFLPDAIRKMSDNELELYAGQYIIDLADAEIIQIKGKPQPEQLQLIVLYGKIDDPNHPTISKAKKIWKNRNSSSVTYTLGPYGGAQAK